MNRLSYNLSETPFSTAGSALAILKTRPAASTDRGDEGYYLRALYEDDRDRLLFRLSFDGSFEGMCDEFREQALRLSKGERSIELCMPETDSIRFHGFCDRFELYMSPKEIIKYNAAMFYDERHIGLNCYTRKEIVYVLKGSAELDAPWGDNESNVYIRVILRPDENGEMDFVFKEFRTEFVKDYLTTSFEEDRERLQYAFEAFADGFKGGQACPETFRRALYTLWNNRLAPNQLIKRDTVLSGKTVACEINAFDNALVTAALADDCVDSAVRQFEVFADEQDWSGACPAWIGSYKIQNRYVLPPVDGIALRGRFAGTDVGCALRDKLVREIDFWLKQRRCGKIALPAYRHPDECAIEACSCFKETPYVISPDLTAYVIAAIDAVIEMSGEHPAVVDEYVALRDELLAGLMEHCFDAATGRFVALSAADGKPIDYDGILCCLPLMIGRHLPGDMAKKLFGTLPERHGTRFDLPEDGEGRIIPGMIYLLIAGLKDAGMIAEAEALAVRLCSFIELYGFAKAFDAADGTPVGERSSSATAAAYVLLAKEYLSGVRQ